MCTNICFNSRRTDRRRPDPWRLNGDYTWTRRGLGGITGEWRHGQRRAGTRIAAGRMIVERRGDSRSNPPFPTEKQVSD